MPGFGNEVSAPAGPQAVNKLTATKAMKRVAEAAAVMNFIVLRRKELPENERENGSKRKETPRNKWWKISGEKDRQRTARGKKAGDKRESRRDREETVLGKTIRAKRKMLLKKYCDESQTEEKAGWANAGK